MEPAVATSQNEEVIDDRRRATRNEFVARAMLFCGEAKERPQWVTLRNISCIGVGFESDTPVEAGSRCRLFLEAGPNRLHWRVRVVCCGKIDHQLYRIGCEFLPGSNDLFDLTDEELGLGESDEMQIFQ